MKDNLRIKELKEQISFHKNQKDKAKDIKVKVLENNKFVDSYDKRTEAIEDYKVKLYTYELELYLASNLWFPRKTLKLEKAWQEYLKAGNKELEYTKSQRTKFYTEKSSQKRIWVSDEFAVSKLLTNISNERTQYDTWVSEHTYTIGKFLNIVMQMKLTKLILIVVAFITFAIGIPALVNLIVTSKAPFSIKVSKENPWIGFWASYIAGTLGALIGGYIAYLISSHQFKKQNELRKQDRLIEIVTNNIPNIIKELNQLNYLVNLDISFIKTLIEFDKEYLNKQYDNHFYNEATNFIDKIHSNKEKIFDTLEQLTNQVNSNRIIINHLVDYYRSLNTEILELINTTKAVDDYYAGLSEAIKSNLDLGSEGNQVLITNNSENLSTNFESMNNRLKRVLYEIYSIETDLQNDLSKVIHGSRLIRKTNFTDYTSNIQ